MIDLVKDAVVLLKMAVDWVLVVVVLGVVVLMVLRWLLLKVQPFGWASYSVRRATDPLIWPIAQVMPANQDAAPMFLILGVLMGAFFFKWLTDDLIQAFLGLLYGVSSGMPLQMIGWLLYGAVAVLLVLIVARIVFSWLPFMRDGHLMLKLHQLTEPVMGPFRQIIPQIGMFDLSPILLILLLQFAQNAIVRVLGLRMMG
ncbi:MAG: YggT family protein [Candidatus Latescibacteria bacterium]|nr:YggT family protein [Candidatus Latescibacterota bacterium]